MNTFLRTNSENLDFKALVALLDSDLAERDGEENAFYAQFNGIVLLKHTVVYYLENKAAGCGAFKKVNSTTVEIKRIYVAPTHRGKGIASKVLNELENWASELNFNTCLLETGLRQPEAIGLYKKNGYQVIPNYVPYEGVENSVCFRKQIK